MFQLSYTRTADDVRQHQYLLYIHMQRTQRRRMLRAFGQPMVILSLFLLLVAVSYQVHRGRIDILLFLLGGIVVGVLSRRCSSRGPQATLSSFAPMDLLQVSSK